MITTEDLTIEQPILHQTLTREIVVAVAGFIAMCFVILFKAPQLLEPDDYAYRASIVALSEGHVLLTNAQYLALKAQLTASGGISQWVHLASGKWISEKNPGYPYFAVIFQWFHALRGAPLFYGAFASGGLFYGARRWLGKWGGTFAVLLYCSSGAALTFAWRSTMPTFTDASFIAAGAGILLGVLLSSDVATRRRLWLGVLAFLSFDAAVFIRYTNIFALAVGLVAVVACYKAASLKRSMLVAWVGSVAVFGVFDLIFNKLVYGGFLKTGYSAGEITFNTASILPNLERMPKYLLESMPMLVLSLAAIIWVALRLVQSRATTMNPQKRDKARRDGLVTLFLMLGWFAMWGLYSMYSWTVNQTLGNVNSVHVIRFYLPALGMIALLAAWFLKQLPKWTAPILLVIIGTLGVVSFHSLTGAQGGPGGPGGGPGGGFGGPGGAPSGPLVKHSKGSTPPNGGPGGQGGPGGPGANGGPPGASSSSAS
jgi:hypothetical protein